MTDLIESVFWKNSREAWLRVDWPSGTIRSANSAASELCGLTLDQLVGQSFWKLLDGVSAERLGEWVEAWCRGEPVGERAGVWLQSTRGGLSVPVGVSAFQTVDSSGERADWVKISDRREVQELAARLSATDARLDEMERVAKLGWWEWDIRRKELVTSNTLRQLFGLPDRDSPPVESDYLAAIHPDDRGTLRQRYQSALQGDRPNVFVTFRVIRPDGSTRHLQVRGRIERSEADEPVRFFGTCQDMTDRIQSVAKLRESEEKYRELVETSREFIWSVDIEGRWTFVNQAVRNIYGFEPDEMIGRPFTLVTSPDITANDWQSFQKVLSGEQLFNYETEHLRKDGKPISLSFNAVALRDVSGQVVGATGTAVDITERKRQQKLLSERESMFRAIFESDPQCLLILTLDGQVVDVNPTAVRLAQVNSANELIGQYAVGCLSVESRYAFQRALATASVGVPRSWQGLIHGKKGGRFWLEGQIVPLRDANGEVVRLLSAGQDFTARKKFDALRDGEQQVLEEIASGHGLSPALQALIKLLESQLPGALICIGLLAEENSFLRVGACSAMSEDVTQRFTAIRVDAEAPSFAATAATGQRRIVEDTSVDPSWVNLQSFADRLQLRSCWSEPIRGFSQKLLGTLTVFWMWPKSPSAEDLKILETGAYLAGIAAHRSRSEQRLRDSELRFRTLFEHSPDAIFVESLSGVVLDVNPAACELHGLSRQELVGRQVVELAPPRWRNEVRRTFPKLIQGELLELEGFGWHPERGEIPISLHANRIEYALQPALLLHVRDITERRRAEAKAREMDSALAHAGRLAVMGELVAGISHEINQPLFAIGNFANACRTVLDSGASPPTAKLSEWINKIIEQSTRAAEIIRRMRDFGRKSPQQPTDVNVAEMIHEATELIAVETRSQHVDLRLQLPAQPVLIRMDRVQIQQVLVNILRNAIRAVSDNPPNDRFVSIRAEVDDKQLTVSIQDNGHGLRDGEAEKIFHPFFTTKSDGLGLGLTISRSIIEAHGGRLWGTSNTDRGATFLFTLPRNNFVASPAASSGGPSAVRIPQNEA